MHDMVKDATARAIANKMVSDFLDEVNALAIEDAVLRQLGGLLNDPLTELSDAVNQHLVRLKANINLTHAPF